MNLLRQQYSLAGNHSTQPWFHSNYFFMNSLGLTCSETNHPTPTQHTPSMYLHWRGEGIGSEHRLVKERKETLLYPQTGRRAWVLRTRWPGITGPLTWHNGGPLIDRVEPGYKRRMLQIYGPCHLLQMDVSLVCNTGVMVEERVRFWNSIQGDTQTSIPFNQQLIRIGLKYALAGITQSSLTGITQSSLTANTLAIWTHTPHTCHTHTHHTHTHQLTCFLHHRLLQGEPQTLHLSWRPHRTATEE